MAAASTGVGAPIAAMAHGVNVAINAADAGMAIASASMDIAEMIIWVRVMMRLLNIRDRISFKCSWYISAKSC